MTATRTRRAAVEEAERQLREAGFAERAGRPGQYTVWLHPDKPVHLTCVDPESDAGCEVKVDGGIGYYDVTGEYQRG